MNEQPVNVSVRQRTGVLELDRPKALNSLNHEMIRIITDALEGWREDPDILTHFSKSFRESLQYR